MSERVQLVNIRTDEVVWEGTDFVEAWNYRRDVLTPKLHNPWKCPYHIRYPDDPDYIAAQKRFEAFRVQALKDLKALPQRMTQGELFDVPGLLGIA